MEQLVLLLWTKGVYGDGCVVMRVISVIERAERPTLCKRRKG